MEKKSREDPKCGLKLVPKGQFSISAEEGTTFNGHILETGFLQHISSPGFLPILGAVGISTEDHDEYSRTNFSTSYRKDSDLGRNSLLDGRKKSR